MIYKFIWLGNTVCLQNNIYFRHYAIDKIIIDGRYTSVQLYIGNIELDNIVVYNIDLLHV